MMGNRLFMGAMMTLAICTSAWGLDLNEQRQFDIPAQKLSTALVEFSRQAKAPVVSATPDVDRFESPGVSGRMSLKEALRVLLQGTGLEIRMTESGAIAVGTFGSKGSEVTGASEDAPRPGHGSAALTGALPYRSDSAVTDASAETSSNTLGEVIVTAQKRSERLQDVPVPVTALSAALLVENNQLELNDYFTSLPGVSVSNDGYHSLPTTAIRGITTGGFGYPTVAIYVDDVPVGSATTYGGGLFAPDLDPSDLQRIEVLRGPQGTLYGASSMGGLIKYVTVDPSTSGFSGRVDAAGSTVYNGNEVGYGFRGSVNVPLSDTLAIRASGFTRLDPGYIDNPVRGINGINEQRVTGGRLATLWQPLDTVTLKLGALYQDIEGSAYNYVQLQPRFGDLQQNYLPGTGIYSHKDQIYSATLTANMGGVNLTSVTGYSVYDRSDVADLSPSPFWSSFINSHFGVNGVPDPENISTHKLTQEIRFSASVGTSFDWLLGGFYTRENSDPLQIVNAENPTTGVLVGQADTFTFPTTYKEYAGFADLTYHFTDQFDIQFGGRESHNDQTYQETDTGLLYLPTGIVYQPRLASSDSSFTYLVTPQFKFSPDLMTYARIASGYRPGGPNTTFSLGLPPQFSPDKTQNYELGVKGESLDRMMSFDTSVYYIDWKNIQLPLESANDIGYFANGSRAKSEGVELSVELRPIIGTTLAGWISYDDAALTESLPATSTVYGRAGDRLPTSSRFSGNLSSDQKFSLNNGSVGFAGATVSYVGNRYGVFTSTPQRQYYGGYTQLDLHSGVTKDLWTFNLSVINVLDKRAYLAGGVGTADPTAFVVNRPRTIGVNLARTF